MLSYLMATLKKKEEENEYKMNIAHCQTVNVVKVSFFILADNIILILTIFLLSGNHVKTLKPYSIQWWPK